jgi:glycosyltransferase involved in cell wall biosynthesis
MRICLYTNTALPKIGGQEIVIDALARQFLVMGHEPIVLAPWRGSQGPFDAESVPYPVMWHPRFVSTRWLVSWYAHWMARLHDQTALDVIHCHGTYPAGYVGACCKTVRHLPLVITSHGDDLAPQGLYDRKPQLRGRYRTALALADAGVAISDYTAGMFREACPELRQIVRIANGVEVAEFATPVARPADLDARIQSKSYLLFLGRLD